VAKSEQVAKSVSENESSGSMATGEGSPSRESISSKGKIVRRFLIAAADIIDRIKLKESYSCLWESIGKRERMVTGRDVTQIKDRLLANR